jgi:hypothetical protein
MAGARQPPPICGCSPHQVASPTLSDTDQRADIKSPAKRVQDGASHEDDRLLNRSHSQHAGRALSSYSQDQNRTNAETPPGCGPDGARALRSRRPSYDPAALRVPQQPPPATGCSSSQAGFVELFETAQATEKPTHEQRWLVVETKQNYQGLDCKPAHEADPQRRNRQGHEQEQANQPILPDERRSRSAICPVMEHVFCFSTQPDAPRLMGPTRRRSRAASVTKLTQLRDQGCATEKPVHGRSQFRAGDVTARRSRVCGDSGRALAGHQAQQVGGRRDDRHRRVLPRPELPRSHLDGGLPFKDVNLNKGRAMQMAEGI